MVSTRHTPQAPGFRAVLASNAPFAKYIIGACLGVVLFAFNKADLIHLLGSPLDWTAIGVSLGLLTGAPWGQPAYLVSVGMLLYTVIVSPGYFAHKREWPMVGMFAVLLVLALVSLGLVLGASLA